MITEDYVSFETAKLLKEKGFDWECIGYYVDYEPNDVKYSFLGETNSTWESRCCSAPTLQMAMKWLREVRNLHIMVDCIGAENYMPTIQFTRTSKDIDIKSKTSKIGGNGFDSYEEACEAAIQYYFENFDF